MNIFDIGRKDRRASRRQNAALERRKSNLLTAADKGFLGGAGIDSVSAQEMLGMMDPGLGVGWRGLGDAESFFQKAKAGTDPKFRSRIATEMMYTTVLAQPGRRQLGIGPQGQARSSFLINGNV